MRNSQFLVVLIYDSHLNHNLPCFTQYKNNKFCMCFIRCLLLRGSLIIIRTFWLEIYISNVRCKNSIIYPFKLITLLISINNNIISSIISNIPSRQVHILIESGPKIRFWFGPDLISDRYWICDVSYMVRLCKALRASLLSYKSTVMANTDI